jgi:F0F1-type ATP synthase membrane subunit b/b'
LNDLRRTLTEEHDVRICRSEVISSYEEKIKRSALETAELHAQQLNQVRNEMANEAEENLKSLKERYESELQKDLERMKSELSKASEKVSVERLLLLDLYLL